MAYQIPYEDPIWNLTPTELNVAYLSLTQTKKQIGEELHIDEKTVGQHLTKIFEKLGLSGFEDDEKRPLLKANFGATIEELAREIDGDYQGEYRRRRNEALKNRVEAAKGDDPVVTSPPVPTMQEPPPAPREQAQSRRVTQRRALPRIIWPISGCVALLVIGSLIGFNFIRGIFNPNPTDPPVSSSTTTSPDQTSVQAATNAMNTQTVSTSTPTQTIVESATTTFTPLPPTSTATPVVPPTAFPLPIIEHFNDPMKDVWQITGEPLLTTSNFNIGYDGILTTLEGHFASIQTGNSAWTDYIIHVRCEPGSGEIILGFRVQDLNNMVGMECVAYNCKWVIFKDGVKEVLSRADDVSLQNEFTLTIQGEKFNGLSNYGSGFGEGLTFVTLPPKYQGQFNSGGVYIRFKEVQIDYIEILPVR